MANYKTKKRAAMGLAGLAVATLAATFFVNSGATQTSSAPALLIPSAATRRGSSRKQRISARRISRQSYRLPSG